MNVVCGANRGCTNVVPIASDMKTSSWTYSEPGVANSTQLPPSAVELFFQCKTTLLPLVNVSVSSLGDAKAEIFLPEFVVEQPHPKMNAAENASNK